MSNRITDTEYAHYCACYTAIKTGAPAFIGGTARESALSALAADDAKGVLGVLPCMSSEAGPLVDLRKIDLNGAQVMTLHYPRGYNAQELIDGAREMAKRATIQDIDNVSARLHAAMTGEPEKVDLSVAQGNIRAEIAEEVYARILKNRLLVPKDPRQVAEEVCSHFAGALERMSKKP